MTVWEKAHALVIHVYGATRSFPKTERYGLTSQMQRAAVSIPANIAEGAGRSTDRDFGRFIAISIGSANELEYLVRLSQDLGYVNSKAGQDLRDQTQEVRRMLSSFRRRLAGSW